MLAKPVEVKLDIAYKYTWAESKTYDTDDNLTKHAASAKEEKFDKAEDEKDNNAKVIGTQKGENASGATTGVWEIAVINRKGFDLPVTGGFGTLLFSGNWCTAGCWWCRRADEHQERRRAMSDLTSP